MLESHHYRNIQAIRQQRLRQDGVRSKIGQRRPCLADDNLIKRHLPSTKHEFIYAMPRQTEH